MRLFLDTNIILEAMLGQERSGEVYSLLQESGRHSFFISDFTVYSIGIMLFRINRYEAYLQFIDDMIINDVIRVLNMDFEDMPSVVYPANEFNLDFDDAYQYALALKHDLNIVSFDRDFDRTDRGRKIPLDIIKAA
jgi:predicted nucleic acid-binding protein